MFDYPKLDRIDDPLGRFYVTPSGIAPSVTTILGTTSDDSWLDGWRARVGEEEAERIREEAAAIGTAMHESLEAHLRGTKQPLAESETLISGQKMARAVAKTALRRVTKIYGIEARVHYGDLYAGTADLACEWNDSPAILDYKSGLRLKCRDTIDGYAEQCFAYSMAHDDMFGTDIRTLVVVECTRWLDVRVHVIEGDRFEAARDGWVRKLSAFYAVNPQKLLSFSSHL